MQEAKRLTLYFYKHSFIRYLFVGGTTFFLDLGTLILLHGKFHISLPLATSIAYWLSVIFNFSLNRWWTFSVSEKSSLQKHAMTYGLLLGFNFIFTVIFVSNVSHHINYAKAKILAVAFQMCWNFFIYKNFIFTKAEHKNTSADKTATIS
ncbi:MAG TPA: GtrA family protein [Candidatus Saccharimonadales bacterium]|nr:GtrA family protein [Candidatus Saccharimonadales bacterium]